ncbi:MAG: tRNA (adenosine(37)-N6)-threonylcarbamoyltransferase complex dimerization subunit type 1 TsaB [Candidatus Cloacimonetes bacterium]|nr:tRNA (adenosine(37)-N6)-threonylcarbamoyltransferase complex dimerization subunit type 1 TsaB [Candidatus Cloacimonadota bacterium]
MNILAIDTSSTSGSIALNRDQKIVFMSYLDVSRTHSERLLSQIDFGLKHCEISVNALDLICIGNGPGSFTGVRIGLATAKGLCLSNQIPLHPFNTLELLAHNLWGTQRAILCLIDARMGEIYGALYDSDHKIIIPPCNSAPAEFLQKIDRPVMVVGDGVIKYRKLLQNSGLDFWEALPHQHLNLAATMISMVSHYQLKPSYDPFLLAELEPFYLRPSQAEVIKKKKLEENI